MARTGAAERYLYSSEYFERLLGSARSWLVLGAREGDRLAGAIAVASDGYLHYYLGGTADEALGDSPMKNLFAAMIALGNELGLPLSLGGGLTPGDSLDDFKRGFANGEAPFHTHELICDPDAYEGLVAESGPAPEGFFPRLPLLACDSTGVAFPVLLLSPLGPVLDPLLHRRLHLGDQRDHRAARAGGQPQGGVAEDPWDRDHGPGGVAALRAAG